MNLFQYDNYKEFLLSLIKTSPNQGRGVRKQLAKAARCQLAYISHVLNGDYDFSLEHAEAIAQFLGLNETELEYFFLLIQFSRAGTPRLKSFFRKQIRLKQKSQNQLKNKVKIETSLNPEDQAIYYSSWVYAAVHMALTIPDLQAPQILCGYFHLKISEVKKILGFLVDTGLATSNLGIYQVAGNFLHLDQDSPMIVAHHSQWRQLALRDVSLNRAGSLHYSSCFSIASSDVPKLKSLLTKFLEEATLVIKPSKEEKLFALGLDLFEV